jgi:hypothetical protein
MGIISGADDLTEVNGSSHSCLFFPKYYRFCLIFFLAECTLLITRSEKSTFWMYKSTCFYLGWNLWWLGDKSGWKWSDLTIISRGWLACWGDIVIFVRYETDSCSVPSGVLSCPTRTWFWPSPGEINIINISSMAKPLANTTVLYNSSGRSCRRSTDMQYVLWHVSWNLNLFNKTVYHNSCKIKQP